MKLQTKIILIVCLTIFIGILLNVNNKVDATLYRDANDLTWYVTLNEEDKTVMITGLAQQNKLDVTVPATITHDGNAYKVTSFGTTFNSNKTIQNLIIEDGISLISDNAFNSCSSLKSITIPNSITSIGQSAFANCALLEKVVIPSGATIGSNIFSGCISLKSVSLPDGLETIAGSTFYNCTSLESITIPNSVTTIKGYAFNMCSSLTSITIPAEVTIIESNTFVGCNKLNNISVDSNNQNFTSQDGILYNKEMTNLIKYPSAKIGTYYTMPNTITDVEFDGITNCSSLKSITLSDSITTYATEHLYGNCSISTISINSTSENLSTQDGVIFDKSGYTLLKYPSGKAGTSYTVPYSVTTVGSSAFTNCTILKSITMQKVKNIENSAFYNCNSLTEVIIPTTATELGEHAFENCTSLVSITIPSSLTTIKSYTFRGCSSLTSVTIPETITTISNYVFENCSSLTTITLPSSIIAIPFSLFHGCTALKSVIIPSGVTKIGGMAFAECTSLTNVTIPTSVTTIESQAFSNCTSLTSITIPTSVKTIEGYTFSGCTSLTTITIPTGVTIIEGCTFQNCTSLTTVTIPTTVTNIKYSSFAYCDKLTTITIPSSVQVIASSAFAYTPNLVNINVDSSNQNFASQDGVLYNKNKTILLIYPRGKTNSEYTIASNVISIGEYAFYQNASLQTVNIPDSLSSIENNSFSGCTSLKNITIPTSLTEFKGFNGCTSLDNLEIPENITSIAAGTIPLNATILNKDCVIQDRAIGAKTVTLTGYRNSTAQEYADAFKEITFIPISQNYKVTLNANEGTINIGNITEYESGVITDLPIDVTKTGYTFGGWYENSECTGTATSLITTTDTGNKTYYAKWTANTNTAYTVVHQKMNLDGSTYTTAETENLTGTTASSITPAVKTYTGFTNPSTQTTTIAADGSTTVTYKYTRNKYAFTLGSCTGVTTIGSTASGSYYFEAPITLKAVVADGYKWSKWSNGTTTQDASITMPANTLTCTPEVTINNYAIKYILNDGTVATTNPTTYTVETESFTLNNPIKTGYTFAGWTGSNGAVAQISVSIAKGTTGDKTFTANWTTNTGTAYTVVHQKMNLDGTTYTTQETENLTGTTGASITPTVKIYTGFTSPSTQTTVIAADGTTVVTYKYERNKYTFTLESCTGVTIEGSTTSGSYFYEAPITLKAIVADGYTWSKWSNGTLEQNTTLTMPASALTCTPEVTVNDYTIEYTLNGGTVAITNSTTYTVETENFTLNNPTKTGYTFEGWTGSNGETAQTEITIIKGSTGDKEYTANWTANIYTIKLNTNDGTINSGNVTSYTYEIGTTLPTDMTREGYVFRGWYDNNNCTGTAITQISVTDIENKEYWAKWLVDTDKDGIPDEEDTETLVAYTVEHYKQNATQNGYDLAETENLTGNLGTTVTATAKTYEGFVENTTNSQRVPSGTVVVDGSLVLKLYYDIDECTVIFKDGDNTLKTETVNYGLDATAPTPTKSGYTLSWDKDFSNVTSDLTVNAIWTANTNTAYKVEHYQQTTDTEVVGYSLFETENLTGTTDTSATASTKEYEGFTVNPSYSETVLSGNIEGDGSLVLKLYYDRNIYNINYELDGGTATSTLISTYMYGKEINLSNRVTKDGHVFIGWYDNSEFTGNAITKISTTDTGDKTFYAKWSQQDELYITSDKHTVDMEENYITKISPNTDVQKFVSNINTNGNVKILNSKREEITSSDLVGTGYIMQIEFNGTTHEYELVVTGDIDGNGKLTVIDLSKMNQAIVGRIELDGAYKKAADLDNNSKLTVIDLSKINQAIVGRITL